MSDPIMGTADQRKSDVFRPKDAMICTQARRSDDKMQIR